MSGPAPAAPAPPRASIEPAPRAREARQQSRSRVVIENIVPNVDCGRFPAKSSVGEMLHVECDAFVDGHDKIGVALRHRIGDGDWREVEMQPLVNDRWAGEFAVHTVGWHEFTIAAWVDRFATWRYDLQKRVAAGQDVGVDLMIGAELVEEAASANEGDIGHSLRAFASYLRSKSRGEATDVALGNPLAALMRQYAPRRFTTEWSSPVRVWVDRPRARFSTWYELFPRSASPDPSRHGTLRDVENRLDGIAAMGFDVLYLPPIHPIGQAFRKGRNNSPVAEPGDVGSPWAIGGPEGGHDAIHSQLGTFEDFDRLVRAAGDRGIEIAM